MALVQDARCRVASRQQCVHRHFSFQRQRIALCGRIIAPNTLSDIALALFQRGMVQNSSDVLPNHACSRATSGVWAEACAVSLISVPISTPSAIAIRRSTGSALGTLDPPQRLRLMRVTFQKFFPWVWVAIL
jgi:hypothetical protein